MLTLDQKALVDAGYMGRMEGAVGGEAIHRCPIRGEIGECFSTDDFHSCKLCGSTWKSKNN